MDESRSGEVIQSDRTTPAPTVPVCYRPRPMRHARITKSGFMTNLLNSFINFPLSLTQFYLLYPQTQHMQHSGTFLGDTSYAPRMFLKTRPMV